MVKNPPANSGDVGSIPGSGRSVREGNGTPLHFSCLGNPMDRATEPGSGGLHTAHRVKKELDTTKQLNNNNINT